MGRLRPAQKKRALDQAQEIAQERARLFRIPRRVMSGTRKGELLTGHRLVKADTDRKRRNLIERGARPVLSSAEWRKVYEEVGLA